MARIEFTDNYQDLSTAIGFQFKFLCESCGNGYSPAGRRTRSASRAACCAARARLRRHLRARGLRVLRDPEGHRGAGARRRARRGRRRDQAAVHPVQALRPVGLPRDLLERRAQPLHQVRADPPARAGGQAGRDRARAGHREAARARPDRGRQLRRDGRGALPAVRRRGEGGQVLP